MHCLHCFGTLDALFWDARCTVCTVLRRKMHYFGTLDALFWTLDALFWDARCAVCTVLVR